MCVVNSKGSEQYHSIGSQMDRTPSRLKTDRDNLMKDNLGCYCPKTFETAKGKNDSAKYFICSPNVLQISEIQVLGVYINLD